MWPLAILRELNLVSQCQKPFGLYKSWLHHRNLNDKCVVSLYDTCGDSQVSFPSHDRTFTCEDDQSHQILVEM